MNKKLVFLDTECYPNYFLICFKSGDTVRYYRLREGEPMDLREVERIMRNYLTVGFNSLYYDLPMITAALKGASNANLKQISNDLVDNKQQWHICRQYNIYPSRSWENIDLTGAAPAAREKLKTYGARLGTRVLQDIPLDHTKPLKGNEFDIIDEYCLNDVNITIDLYNELKGDIELREMIGKNYNLELRSKSKPQIAEAIIRKELGLKYTENKVDTTTIYKYTAPESIILKGGPATLELYNRLQECEFTCREDGKLIKDVNIPRKVSVKGFPLSVGIGGLHSTEKHIITTTDIGLESVINSQITTSEKDHFILDLDVSSYYPSVILANNYYPAQLGPRFAELYRSFHKEKVEAEKNNDDRKVMTYKLILNGVFGKYGSIHSSFYSPSMLLHTTITGQLALLMLIEHVLERGIFTMISVNTDGIVVKGSRAHLPELRAILENWSRITGLNLKHTFYKTIYHESVSSYIAVREDNTLKRKGVYAHPGISKNPIMTVCVDAVIDYLQQGTKIEDTIFNSRNDIKKFLIMRTVKGGGYYKGQYLGKVVRWYYGITGDRIVEGNKGDQVAGSEGAIPLMVIPDQPVLNIDLEKYVMLGYRMLGRLGVQCGKTT